MQSYVLYVAGASGVGDAHMHSSTAYVPCFEEACGAMRT